MSRVSIFSDYLVSKLLTLASVNYQRANTWLALKSNLV